MRTIIYKGILFLFILISNIERGNSQNLKDKIENNHITMITINYVAFDTETPLRIDCKHFYSYFYNTFKTKKIYDCKIISKITNYLSENKKDNKKAFPVDVRFRIKIYYSDKTIKEICGNKSVIEIDGKEYIISPDFLNYLLSIDN
jgi:hypothetical protein